jgi:hypothetical protein
MIKIEKVLIGRKKEEATQLFVRIMSFDSNATNCQLYWELQGVSGEIIDSGNIQLTDEQFTSYGQDNTFVENIVISELVLTRKIEI